MDLGQVLFGLAGIALGYNSLQRGARTLHAGLRGAGGGRSRGVRVERDPGPAGYKGRPAGRINNTAGDLSLYEVRNLDDRINAIRDRSRRGKVDPKVIAWARRQVSARCPSKPGGWCVPEKNKKAEAAAIFHGMRRDVRYVNDPLHVDLYVHPRRTLEHKAADCDDFSSLGCSSLMAIGIPCELEVVRTKDSKTWNHIYVNAVLPDGERYSLDASVPVKPGWRVPDSYVAERRVFEVKPS